MRKSRVLREMHEGKLAPCAKVNLADPRVVEICGLMGFSCVWVCHEHVPNDWSFYENAVRAGKIHDLDVIVRVSKGSYSEMLKPFECDAAGVMVPHVTSAAEAAEVVETCRCHPLGKRPLDGGNVDGHFCQLPAEEYTRLSNEEKFIILQIESPEAVDAVDEIAAVPGFEFLLFGPGDFAHRIGKVGQINVPEVEEARRRVEEAAAKHGKKCFGVGASGTPEELLGRGYSIVNLASDVGLLTKSMDGALAAFRRTPVQATEVSVYDRNSSEASPQTKQNMP